MLLDYSEEKARKVRSTGDYNIRLPSGKVKHRSEVWSPGTLPLGYVNGVKLSQSLFSPKVKDERDNDE